MWELLSRINSSDLTALFFFAIMAVVAITIASAALWQKHRERELAVTIIQDMLDQGMTAEQIERVLSAGGFGRRSARRNALREKVQAVRDKVGQTAG